MGHGADTEQQDVRIDPYGSKTSLAYLCPQSLIVAEYPIKLSSALEPQICSRTVMSITDRQIGK